MLHSISSLYFHSWRGGALLTQLGKAQNVSIGRFKTDLTNTKAAATDTQVVPFREAPTLDLRFIQAIADVLT